MVRMEIGSSVDVKEYTESIEAQCDSDEKDNVPTRKYRIKCYVSVELFSTLKS